MARATRLLFVVAGGLAAAGLVAGQANADASALEKYPGAKEQIMEYYRANAREGGGNCGAGNMNDIGEARVVSEDASSLVVNVHYMYSASTLTGGSGCSGMGERDFTFTKSASGLTINDMSGQGP